MDWGSVADWLNMAATVALAVIATIFSIRQYNQQRDSELKVVLKSVEEQSADGKKKTFSGYELVAINNSAGNCVILKNTTAQLVTEARGDIFKETEYTATGDPATSWQQKLVVSKSADRFVMDQEVKPQATATLWHFTSNLRGRIPKNSNPGSADKMDWYFCDVVNQQHYKVVISQSNDDKRLVAELHTQKEPFAHEQWGQELEWKASPDKGDGAWLGVINHTEKNSLLIEGQAKENQGQDKKKLTPEQYVSVGHFAKIDKNEEVTRYFHDVGCGRYYKVVVRRQKKDSHWFDAAVQSQLVEFEENEKSEASYNQTT